MIKELNVKPHTINLEQNVGRKHLDNGLDNDFIGYDRKSTNNKSKK